MNEHNVVSLISALGFLILAGSALLGRQMSWRSGLVMALAWAAIFAIVMLFISLFV